jgi:hypothetical protein
MGKFDFDALARITVNTLKIRGNMFQPYYLRDAFNSNIWTAMSNEARKKTSFEARHCVAFADINAVLYRPGKIIIAVTTDSHEFALVFAEWLRQHCGSHILENIPPLPTKPLKSIGRKRLDCNEWAAEQHVDFNRPYKEIMEEWKQRYYQETGKNPDEILDNPLRSLRQATSEYKAKKYQEMY